MPFFNAIKAVKPLAGDGAQAFIKYYRTNLNKFQPNKKKFCCFLPGFD
jgi:hypothetical protein